MCEAGLQQHARLPAQAAGADMPGNAVPAGHLPRQEGMGLKADTEQEWPGMGMKQAFGGGLGGRGGWE